MKRIVISLLLFMAAGLVALASPALAEDPIPLTQPLRGYYTYGKQTGVTVKEAISGAAAATTIPLGLYSLTSSRDSNHYSGVLVGRSPFFHGARTTNIPTFIVPVKVKTSDGHAFDPSATDSTCLSGKEPLTVFQNSPLFQPVAFTMNGVGVGTTQYCRRFRARGILGEGFGHRESVPYDAESDHDAGRADSNLDRESGRRLYNRRLRTSRDHELRDLGQFRPEHRRALSRLERRRSHQLPDYSSL